MHEASCGSAVDQGEDTDLFVPLKDCAGDGHVVLFGRGGTQAQGFGGANTAGTGEAGNNIEVRGRRRGRSHSLL